MKLAQSIRAQRNQKVLSSRKASDEISLSMARLESDPES
jgi:hypothetical protein